MPCDKALPTEAHPEALAWLQGLYSKFEPELAALAEKMVEVTADIDRRRLSAGCADFDGEMLYMLIREQRPRLIYELSPNAGHSTAYMLAAIEQNGFGHVKGFELDAALGGNTLETIRRTAGAVGSFDRYQLVLGDATQTVPKELEKDGEGPDFILLDSLHEDHFARFYFDILLSRFRATVMIQDIVHYDPRPEGSTEADYVLRVLGDSGAPYLPLSHYEDLLLQQRSELSPRRPVRSSSILLESPVPWRDNPEAPDYSDTAWGHLLKLEGLLIRGAADSVVAAFHPVPQDERTKGCEIPSRLAVVGSKVNMTSAVIDWSARARAAARDMTHAAGYRSLLRCADAYLRIGMRSEATESVYEAARYLQVRPAVDREKIRREMLELAGACPRLLPSLIRSGGVGTLAATRHMGLKMLKGMTRPFVRWGRRALQASQDKEP